jgi:ATP-dependent DNA ligase
VITSTRHRHVFTADALVIAAARSRPRIDGELVLWTEGRIDFATMQRRLYSGASRARQLSLELPAAYVVFDLLALAGTDIRPKPVAGRTTPLPRAARTEIAAMLTPAVGGHPWPPVIPSSRFGHLASASIEYVQVAPTRVVELDVDVSFEDHRWRHGARFVRIGADLQAADVPGSSCASRRRSGRSGVGCGAQRGRCGFKR